MKHTTLTDEGFAEALYQVGLPDTVKQFRAAKAITEDRLWRAAIMVELIEAAGGLLEWAPCGVKGSGSAPRGDSRGDPCDCDGCEKARAVISAIAKAKRSLSRA